MNGLSHTLSEQLSAPDGSLPPWAEELSERAGERFRASGLPTVRLEDWKYTSLRPLENAVERLAGAERAEAATGPTPEVAADFRVVMASGGFGALEGGLPDGVRALSLREAMTQEAPGLEPMLRGLDSDAPAEAFLALNSARLGRGLYLHVPAGVDAGHALLHWQNAPADAGELINTRVVVVLEAGARLALSEWHDADVASALNQVTQLALSPDAQLRHTRLQGLSREAIVLSRTEVQQQRDSRYEFTGLELGAALARHGLRVSLGAPGARCSLAGAYLPGGRQHHDYHLDVRHQAPGCGSEQFFRGVLRAHGRAVFNGRVHVYPGADGSEARQSNANLLLSEHAEVDTKPELVIEADEVVASHGATVGQLDDDAVFYLRTRGLDEAQARQLLTGAFCRAALEVQTRGAAHEALLAALDIANRAQS